MFKSWPTIYWIILVIFRGALELLDLRALHSTRNTAATCVPANGIELELDENYQKRQDILSRHDNDIEKRATIATVALVPTYDAFWSCEL